MADKTQLFGDLLRYVEGGDANRPISIFIEGATWDFEARDLKNILLIALFEAPSLRKTLDVAKKDVETLQEQTDTAALKRTLHHLYEQVEGETLTFEPPKWEYRTAHLSINQQPNDDKLNELGDDTWELIAVANSVAYFKRPK